MTFGTNYYFVISIIIEKYYTIDLGENVSSGQLN